MSDSLLNGLKHGFIDKTINSEEKFTPQFITNDPDKKEKVLTSIKHEMRNCDEFMFSVAFVNNGGVNALLSEFKILEESGIKGKIIASQYQNFTDPKALKKLKSFKNIEIKVITEDQTNMHSKCYIFRKGENYNVIIGSSNLTNSALCSNEEWNIKFSSTDSGDLINSIVNEFIKDFERATPITDVWIEEYSLIYDEMRTIRKAIKNHRPESVSKGEFGRIQPNVMQTEALSNIQKIRNEGGDRALVISATGSGKTYLSAFDAKIFGKKYLYIVHRLPILNKSMESFKKVMHGEMTVGKYDPELNNLDNDCTFTTIQTISKDYVLSKIQPNEFEYILIDEVHHIGATTYQKVLKHLKPKFLLGMTATPDRTDNYDIYGFFNYNIAYDIRLKQAIEYKLICPFHYFGIADVIIDDELYDDKKTFNSIEHSQRVDHVIRNIKFYGHDGHKVRGLIFCSRIKEAEEYSKMFNERGFKTDWVSGDNPEKTKTCIELLESDGGNSLDYIFTVDLFNEGVDIPSLNQIVMLRPTESPIVYIQQLGRGLRLNEDKDFVVVLDFIGNYEKNYNIPLALSDDRSYNKSFVRSVVSSGDSIIPGNSTISFDEISKSKIYESIDNSDFRSTKLIYEEYNNLKMKLGRIPSLMDFKNYGSVDPLNILSKFGSYYSFLVKKEDKFTIRFSDDEEKTLSYLSKIIAPGKRLLEIEALKIINSNTAHFVKSIKDIHPEINNLALNNIVSVFDGSFYSGKQKLIVDDKTNSEYLKMISSENFLSFVQEILDLGSYNNTDCYSRTYNDTNFVLNMMYTYDDVCRLMNWKKNINAQNIGGYKYDELTNTFSIFINYVKDEKVVESQRYEDRFESKRSLIAISKSIENNGSKNMCRVRDSKLNNTKIHLFVRKNKNDEGSKEFYYLGEVEFVEFIGNSRPATIRYKLLNEVRSDLYDYFNSSV